MFLQTTSPEPVGKTMEGGKKSPHFQKNSGHLQGKKCGKRRKKAKKGKRAMKRLKTGQIRKKGGARKNKRKAEKTPRVKMEQRHQKGEGGNGGGMAKEKRRCWSNKDRPPTRMDNPIFSKAEPVSGTLSWKGGRGGGRPGGGLQARNHKTKPNLPSRGWDRKI